MDFKQLNLYMNTKNNDLFIIPTGRIEGLGIVEIEHMEYLKFPYDEDLLFEKVERAFDLCYSKIPPIPAKESAFANLLGVKNYSAATSNKKLITITWVKEEGYKLQPTHREKRFGYRHLIEKSIYLGKILNKDELFQSVQKSLNISRI
jgi:hypothetical protein